MGIVYHDASRYVAVCGILFCHNPVYTMTITLKKICIGPHPSIKAASSNSIGRLLIYPVSTIIAKDSLVVVPVMIVYIFMQKYIIKGMTAGAVKG